MFESFETDVVCIDYVVRGFTRDTNGARVFMDHSVNSIQDFIAPSILEVYECEDLTISRSNIWQTKMMRKELKASDYFPKGEDLSSSENLQALEFIRQEMSGVYNSI